MKPKWIIWSVCLVALFGCLMVFGLWWDGRGPFYQGRSLEYWLNQTNGRVTFLVWHLENGRSTHFLTTSGFTPEAEKAIRHFGTNILPTLKRKAQEPESPLRAWIRSFLAAQSWLPVRLESPQQRRGRIMGAILFLEKEVQWGSHDGERRYRTRQIHDWRLQEVGTHSGRSFRDER